MPDAVIFVHDRDPDLLFNHCVPLLTGRYALEEHGFEVRANPNRNAFLAEIAAERRQSVALVDLQLDDRRDHNYSGHRIIETIRRHRLLSHACRPLAFTVHAYPRIVTLVEQHGAWGLLARAPLDGMQPADLAGQLHSLLRKPTVGAEAVIPMSILPHGFEVREVLQDQRHLIDAIGKVFSRKRDLNPKQWMVLRYVADKLEDTAIDRFIHEEFGVSGGKIVEELKGKLRLEYKQYGPDLRQAAQDLFLQFPHKRPVPTDALSLRLLQHLDELQKRDLSRLRREGYLDDAAWQTLDEVLFRLDFDKLGNNAGQHLRVQAVEDVLDDLVAGAEPHAEAQRRRRQAELIRAVNNLVDTDAAR